MVVVTAIVVTVGVSAIIVTAIVDLHLTAKEIKNIKTDEELEDFERRNFSRFSYGLPMIGYFPRHLFRKDL